MTDRPALDFALLGNRRWCWAAGCWREWSTQQNNWLPSEPPPASAEFLNYQGWLKRIRD